MSSLSLDGFSNEAKNLIKSAQKMADDNKSRYCHPAHILVRLLAVDEIASTLKELEVNLFDINSRTFSYLAQILPSKEECSLAPSTIALINRAVSNVEGEDRPITSFDLLYSLSQDKSEFIKKILAENKITPEKLSVYVNRGKDLDIDSSQYFTNLSLLAKKEKSDTIIGREAEVRRVIQVLGRRNNNHPILIGEPGVGKRTIALSLVERIRVGNAPRSFMNKSVVQLNLNNLLAGVNQRGEAETRLKSILKVYAKYSLIVYIRSLDSLINHGKVNLTDLFGVFFDFPNVQIITATTPASWKKFVEKEPALSREFTDIKVEPTPPEKAVEVLRSVAAQYERHHNIRIGEACINSAVKLARRHVADKFLPASAIELIDEAASNKMLEYNGLPNKFDKMKSRHLSVQAQIIGLSENTDKDSLKILSALRDEERDLSIQLADAPLPPTDETWGYLNEESIATVLESWTGIPATKFLEGEAQKVAKMEENLAKKVIDQSEAIKAVVGSIKRSRAGLRNPRKPIGSFLCFGSSGVGKTLLAKVVASYLFDSEDNFTRIDMSEFQEKHTISRLLGSPPGYQGSEEGGYLTEAVKKKPYSVVLFDEVEKAHPEIFNILLQVLDDGRLTDSKNRVVDFSNTIIFLTSNCGSDKILAADPELFSSSDGVAKVKKMIEENVNSFFRPEFLNRIDNQIIFKPLSKMSLEAIADIEFKRLEETLAEREVKFEVTQEAKNLLVNIGYVPAFGARPLHRAIMSNVQDPIAEKVLDPEYNPDTKIVIDSSKDGEGFTLSLVR